MSANVSLPNGITVLNCDSKNIFERTLQSFALEEFHQDKFIKSCCSFFKQTVSQFKENEIKIENYVRYLLRMAIILKNNSLIDKIIAAANDHLDISLDGVNTLLYILPEGPEAHIAAIKLIKAGGNINCALGDHMHKRFSSLKVPMYATPLYFVAERSKYLPTLCFLERNGAKCYPKPTIGGQKLIEKAHWLNNSGLLFYMGASYCQDFILNKFDIPMDVVKYLIQVCIRL